ncbi:helix-turn-helix transcriptional regulator [Methylococcus mesophilus]|uniref:helix-turn-helix transcriptional regulator n=1 Tax=Methylococcus mesophilus TaxID=2993564 RepID=UPI00224B2F49|nr:AraC family transcriptional regulator [Methylococcus mesophilus]UZR27242.1 AraC family transcriptional regulator [Methylococcus mesophilus]
MTGKGVVFSSADLPEKDRFHVWRETFLLKMVGLDASRTDPRPFFARMQLLDLGDIKLVRSTGTSAKYHRTLKLVAEDGRDDFTFNINIAGRWEHAESRRRVVLDRPGATLLYTGVVAEGAVSSASLGEYAEFASVCIPRSVLLKRLPRADRLLMAPVGDRKALSLLEALLKSIEIRDFSDTPDLRRLVGEHILDLVIFMLGQVQDAEREGAAGGVRAARRAALTHYIEKNYRCQSLSVDDVANTLKISRRYFFDLMDETGESFTEILNRLRLDRARQLLADPNYQHLGIADIALDSGFGDISYFYRQFRRRFGETPGAFRTLGTSLVDSGK